MECIFETLCKSKENRYTFRLHCPTLGKEWENLIICDNCLNEFLNSKEHKSFNSFARKKLNEIIPKIYFQKLKEIPGEKDVL